MQQADQIVQNHGHRPAARLGIAVRDLHRDFFMRAQHHRRLVAAVIDQRIVQAAEARAGIERDVGKSVALDQVNDNVRLPAAIILIGMRSALGLFLHRTALLFGPNLTTAANGSSKRGTIAECVSAG